MPKSWPQRLGRSPSSVRKAAYRYRISLRRPGSRRGVVLGQPRGVSLRRELREDLASGRVDPTVLARRMRLDEDAELCPSCAARPVRVRQTGLCRVCHLHRLEQAHREALAELEAQRGLWQSRQELKRARDRGAAEGWGDQVPESAS